MSAFDISNRDYDFKMGQYFSRGWDIFKANALPFIGFTLLIGIIVAVVSLILPYPLGSGNPEAGQIGGNIVGNILSTLLGPGFYIVALQIARNRPTSFSDFFGGFKRALPILLLAIISGVLITLGFILVIIPGIYLAVSYMISLPLLLDKNLDFWPALETSRKVVGKKWFSFFGFALLLGLLNLGGLILVGLGLLITVPLTACAVIAAYEDIVGLNSVANM
ncbi:hypothetical protein PN498_20755 [Oscillatoria sp. CS-180]|uniref:hypothetical protein n=1 Tax=Oscillatoria sp. CS-180 TaxID=3021720 RepID=UPI002330486E|nr:hypothetical protein [Oscillatoria sp. CS-180]MDB9528434.1 hypothetical protein [Oscillatoria sp. CS-180]